MRLSDAMREGAKIRPKGLGDLFVDGKSCALGAAAEGNGMSLHGIWGDLWLNIMETWPELDQPDQECPYVKCAAMRSYSVTTLADVVIHLNDEHGWTRERIADWLDGREASPISDEKEHQLEEREEELVNA
jgi:hypothetical protein